MDFRTSSCQGDCSSGNTVPFSSCVHSCTCVGGLRREVGFALCVIVPTCLVLSSDRHVRGHDLGKRAYGTWSDLVAFFETNHRLVQNKPPSQTFSQTPRRSAGIRTVATEAARGRGRFRQFGHRQGDEVDQVRVWCHELSCVGRCLFSCSSPCWGHCVAPCLRRSTENKLRRKVRLAERLLMSKMCQR